MPINSSENECECHKIAKEDIFQLRRNWWILGSDNWDAIHLSLRCRRMICTSQPYYYQYHRHHPQTTTQPPLLMRKYPIPRPPESFNSNQVNGKRFYGNCWDPSFRAVFPVNEWTRIFRQLWKDNNGQLFWIILKGFFRQTVRPRLGDVGFFLLSGNEWNGDDSESVYGWDKSGCGLFLFSGYLSFLLQFESLVEWGYRLVHLHFNVIYWNPVGGLFSVELKGRWWFSGHSIGVAPTSSCWFGFITFRRTS